MIYNNIYVHAIVFSSRYDPRHNTWCTIEPLRQQHADHCVCVVDKYIYTIGGRDYTNELDCVERYNPQTNTWEYVAPLKREVDCYQSTIIDLYTEIEIIVTECELHWFPFSRSLRVTSDDRRIGISPERPIHFECN